MNSEDSSLSPLIRETRARLLRKISQERRRVASIHLSDPLFGQAVQGFSLLETLEDDNRIRWMGPRGEVCVEPGVSSLRLRARSDVPENRVEVALDGEVLCEGEFDSDWRQVQIDLPASSAKGGRNLLTLTASKFIQPPGDPRHLALLVSEFDLGEPHREPSPETAAPHFPLAQWIECELPRWESRTLAPDHPPTKAIIAQRYLRPRDAMSHEALAMARILEDQGMTALLLAEQVHSEFATSLLLSQSLTCTTRLASMTAPPIWNCVECQSSAG